MASMEVEPKATESEEKKEDNDNDNNDEQKSTDTMTIQTPFWGRIKNSKRILLSGCGGGFDIYQGIPLFFTLRQMGYEVFLANYTFCYDIENEKEFEFLYYDINSKAKEEDPLVVIVDANKVSLNNVRSQNYFPEYYLSLYFKEKQKMNVPIYTFPHFGYQSLCNAYEILVDKLDIDTVITIDGGTDSLMKGMISDLVCSFLSVYRLNCV